MADPISTMKRTERSMERSLIVSSLATPDWPKMQTMAWTFVHWYPLCLCQHDIQPIVATRPGDLAVAIRDVVQERCQYLEKGTPVSMSIPAATRSWLLPMQGTLPTKFPLIMNLILDVPIVLDWVNVAPSPVHGEGVFAKKDIPQNTIVTTYPADLLMLLSDVGAEERRQQTISFDRLRKKTQQLIYMSRRDLETKAVQQLSRDWDDYGLEHPSGCSIFADPYSYTPSKCGHKINDALDTGHTNNCMECFLCHGVVIGILSSRDIKEGEELFMSYGKPYWEERRECLVYESHTEPSTSVGRPRKGPRTKTDNAKKSNRVGAPQRASPPPERPDGELRGKLEGAPHEASHEDIVLQPRRRRNIPKSVKINMWNRYIGDDKRIGSCSVCGEPVRMEHCHAAHVVAVAVGGSNRVDNLRPAHALCNMSMGTENLDVYRAMYY
jgi:hypothetical protein